MFVCEKDGINDVRGANTRRSGKWRREKCKGWHYKRHRECRLRCLALLSANERLDRYIVFFRPVALARAHSKKKYQVHPNLDYYGPSILRIWCARTYFHAWELSRRCKCFDWMLKAAVWAAIECTFSSKTKCGKGVHKAWRAFLWRSYKLKRLITIHEETAYRQCFAHAHHIDLLLHRYL